MPPFIPLLLVCAGCAAVPPANLPVPDSVPGISLPSSTRVLGRAAVYVSEAGETLEVVHDPLSGGAIVKLPDGGVTLLPAELAGGEGRYRNSRMTLWEHEGGGVTFWVEGKLLFSGRSAK